MPRADTPIDSLMCVNACYCFLNYSLIIVVGLNSSPEKTLIIHVAACILQSYTALKYICIAM